MTDAEIVAAAIVRCGSQRELAEVVGVTRVTVTRWAAGETLKPSIKLSLLLLLRHPKIFAKLMGREPPEISSVEQRLQRLEDLLPDES